MKKDKSLPISRRNFCSLATCAFVAIVSFASSGCTVFKSMTHEKNAGFDKNTEGEDEDNNNVFDSERKKQDATLEFVAQNGRKTKNKKGSVRPGDDFLLSDKAKEIYANTERR